LPVPGDYGYRRTSFRMPDYVTKQFYAATDRTVLVDHPANEQCRFCVENHLLDDSPVASHDLFYVLPGRDPVLPVAAMVIPRRHIETPFDLSPVEWQEMGQALESARNHLARFKPDGFTVGWNVGGVAGQTVAHAHLHVIGRYSSEPGSGQGLRAALKALQGSFLQAKQ
jgi:diadenosine tetraphosphate (Ap4A) HIT family hydrolase